MANPEYPNFCQKVYAPNTNVSGSASGVCARPVSSVYFFDPAYFAPTHTSYDPPSPSLCPLDTSRNPPTCNGTIASWNMNNTRLVQQSMFAVRLVEGVSLWGSFGALHLDMYLVTRESCRIAACFQRTWTSHPRTSQRHLRASPPLELCRCGTASLVYMPVVAATGARITRNRFPSFHKTTLGTTPKPPCRICFSTRRIALCFACAGWVHYMQCCLSNVTSCPKRSRVSDAGFGLQDDGSVGTTASALLTTFFIGLPLEGFTETDGEAFTEQEDKVGAWCACVCGWVGGWVGG
mgnify:CR=1 FL=1